MGQIWVDNKIESFLTQATLNEDIMTHHLLIIKGKKNSLSLSIPQYIDQVLIGMTLMHFGKRSHSPHQRLL